MVTCPECGLSGDNHIATCSLRPEHSTPPFDGSLADALLTDYSGTHLASLNLFREADGRVYITVVSARGARSECPGEILVIDYVNRLIHEAATTTLKVEP